MAIKLKWQLYHAALTTARAPFYWGVKFCPECGAYLTNEEKERSRCSNGHSLSLSVVLASEHRPDPTKNQRKLPETEEERAAAYMSALARLERFLTSKGFTSYVSEGGTLMVGRGKFLFDAKIVPNDGRQAYVTSNANYRPDKAGTRESGATIITTRSVMQASVLLRVTATSLQTGKPVYLELRKNIPDPEALICKTVLGILEEALRAGSQLHGELNSTAALRDVPPEWLPSPDDEKLVPHQGLAP